MSSEEGLRLVGVTVRYGDLVAVRDVSLALPPGRVLALLGPSGCGKSTLLRAVAGLEPLASGRVVWQGQDMASVAVHRRGFGLMFQEHALFPHRNVAANVEFGLRMAGVAKREREDRVAELLELVGLADLRDRTIGTLSGGQAQRVALARALAPRPQLLLLDEPLGSLDRALRDRLVHDIRRIITELGITAVHVTHDHDEAISVADDLALMERGRITTTGPADELLASPPDARTATALGVETVWHVQVDDRGRVDTPLGPATVPVDSGEAVVLLRPAYVHLTADGVPAVVRSARHRNGVWLTTCDLGGGLSVVASAPTRRPEGSRVCVSADLDGLEPLAAAPHEGTP